MIHTRRHLTLVEILIVITLLTLFAGVIGLNVRRAYSDQKFRTEVALLTDTLRLAQDLMLIQHSDATVTFKLAANGQTIEYKLETEEAVPKSWKPTLERSHRKLEEIHYVNFIDEGPFPSTVGEIRLRFLSGGTLMSKGVFQISSHQNPETPGAMNRIICLRGYPHPIISENKPLNTVCEESDDEGFRSRLTLFTVQEIQEDVQEAAPVPKPEENQEKQEEPLPPT